MKNIKNNPIIIPLEFKVACAMNKIEIQQVLQVFIDHVSLYDTLSNVYSEGFTEATKTISSYILSRKDNTMASKSLKKCRDIAVSCIRMIVTLFKKAPDKVDQNRKKIQPLVIKLYTAMEHFYAPTNQIEVDQYGTLDLNKDFCILCELHSCYPNEFLEYFMNNVSLAEAHARDGLKIYVQNFPLVCFIKINNTLRKDKDVIISLDDQEKQFYQKSRELRLSLFNIRDLEERTRILREFYLSYYQKMNP